MECSSQWQRVIGIVGGLGPYAHLELERLILASAIRRLGRAARDQDYPAWIVSSAPSTPDRTAAVSGEGPSPAPALEESLRRLAGADFAVIACVTAHAFLDDLRTRSPLPLVDVIHETMSEAFRRLGAGGKLGVLATTGTLRAGLFEKAAAQGLWTVATITLMDLPDGESLQETLVMTPIYGPVCDGRRVGGGIKSGGLSGRGDLESSAEPLRQAARRLADAGADLIVTACTEIPLALGRERVGDIPLLDPMAVAADVCVAIAAGERPLPS